MPVITYAVWISLTLTHDLDLGMTYVDFYLPAYISLKNRLIALKNSGNVDCIFGQMIYVPVLLSHAASARGIVRI